MSEAEKFGKEMEITAQGNQDNDRRFYLYPEINYAFHRVLYDIWDVESELNDTIKSAIIEPTIFSVSRSFHWFGVAKWDASLHAANDRRVNPNEIITAIRKEKDYWKEFCDNVLRCHLPAMRKRAQKAAEYISGYVDSGIPILENEWVTAFKHLLSLHSGYHHDPELYLDGIVLRNLEKLHQEGSHSIRIDYMQGDLEESDERHPSYVKYPWARVKFFCKHGQLPLLLKPYQCQELNKAGEYPSDLTPEEVDQIKHRSGFSVATTLLNEIYFKHVPSAHDGKKKAFIVIPIYDVWIESEAWGSLCGNLLLFFAQEDSEGNGVTPALYDRLIDKTRLLSAEFYKSGLNLLLAQPIAPPYDLIEHFLKHIQIIQDWDRVIVYRGTVPQCCYYWRGKGVANQDDPEWQRCDCGKGATSQSSCGQCRQWNETRSENIGKQFLRWEQDVAIWSDQFLSDISEEEKQKFHDRRLVFEYPITACIPEDKTKRKMLDEEYIRQQLEVLRGLIPKVRARRAALRSAVSAIMGRNMSHNIGSHVLARYSSKIKDDLDNVAPDKVDHRGDFLSYLQRRMDFLAEVATSDQAFWSQPLSLKEQISRLNYGEQQKRFTQFTECKPDPSCLHHLSPRGLKEIKNNPVILSFITGKESLLASVEYGAPEKTCDHPSSQAPTDCCRGYLPNQKQEDVWFACPGGEVGVHALYIILENIIRNSARHGGTSDGTVRIFVHVESDQPDSDLLQVEIIDPRTELKPVQCGEEIKGEMTDGVKKEEATEEVKELETRHADSLFEDGKRKKLICLDREINSILHDEPFLDASGNPNPKYWGVREMQICAHYLRGNRLSDLEGMRDNKPVLEAGVHKLENGSHCLKYTLHLQRAKLMAAVVRDDSTYKGQAKKLRQKGIFVVGSGNGGVPDWKKIAADVSGYSFLVVEEGIDLPKEMRASLPVRTFNLPLKKIKAAIDDPSQEIAWMEPLHQHWAEKCRNRRYAWMGKPLWGVVVEGGEALKVLNTGASPSALPPVQKKGLFRVLKGSNTGAILPLPDSVEEWHKSLENEAIAAAWVDHLKGNQFGLGGARLEQAIVFVTTGIRRWISVEGAFSDSPHSAYLNSCLEGSGWEILAAAVLRVAVLDERVQSELNTLSRTDIPFSKAWACMGVWVPEKPKKNGQGNEAGNGNGPSACDLDAPVFDQIQAFLKHPASRQDQFPIDFLVIHLTLLERLSNEKNGSLRKTLTELISGTQAKDAEIIIVTGRGVPSIALDPDNMDNVRYLPISALLESLVARPSKLALMRVIWSASRPG